MYVWGGEKQNLLGLAACQPEVATGSVGTHTDAAAAGSILSSQCPLFHFSVGGMETFTA